MAQKWIQKASIQTAIVAGIFLLIATIIGAFLTFYLPQKGQKRPLVQKFIITPEKQQGDSLSIEQAKFRENEVGVLVLRFDDISNTAEGKSAAHVFAGHIQNELNTGIEAIIHSLQRDKHIKINTSMLARRISKAAESHRGAREIGNNLKSEVVVWGSLFFWDFRDNQELHIIPHITIVDTLSSELLWKHQKVRQFDLNPVLFSDDSEQGLNLLRTTINTALQLTAYSACSRLQDDQKKRATLELLQEVILIHNDYTKHLPDIYGSLAGLYSFFRNYDQELKVLEKCYEIEPNSPDVLNDLANVYGKVGIQYANVKLSSESFSALRKAVAN